MKLKKDIAISRKIPDETYDQKRYTVHGCDATMINQRLNAGLKKKIHNHTLHNLLVPLHTNKSSETYKVCRAAEQRGRPYRFSSLCI